MLEGPRPEVYGRGDWQALVVALMLAALAAGCSRTPASEIGAPGAPPGVDPERVFFTSSVCAAAVMTLPGGKLDVGCPFHPPFDRPEQKPDGKLSRFTGDPLRLCTIDAIYRGSFTRAGAKQAVLSFAACKNNPPHDDEWDAAYPGSALLVEDAGGRWSTIAYEPGVNADACLVDSRATGRDVLLCRSGLRAGNAGGITYFFSLDFALPARRAGTFAKVYDGTLLCASIPEPPGASGGEPLLLPHGLVTVKVTDFVIADVNTDGIGDLVVDVERARAAPSAALDAKAVAACKRNPEAHEDSVLPPPTKTRLAFVSRGDVIAPTDATRRVLEAWLTEVGDNGGLTEAAPPPLVE